MLRLGRFILVVVLIAGGLPRLSCCCIAATVGSANKGCPHCAGGDNHQGPKPDGPCKCLNHSASKFVATKAVPVDAPGLNLTVSLSCDSRPQISAALASGEFVRAAAPKSHPLSIPLLLGHLLL